VSDETPADLAAARDEVEQLTARVLELRDQYYEANAS
jgi:DNA ligase (NAD+)